MYPDKKNVQLIIDLLKSKGFHASYSKDTFFQHLHMRMSKNHCLTYEDYLQLLTEDKEEYDLLNQSFSVHVTQFFRDPEVFNLFSIFFQIYMKEIINRNQLSRLRIWSAGCANGSEPYTVSMIVQEILKHRLSRYDVQIYATDINSEVLEFAKEGKYPESIKEEIPSHYFQKHTYKSNNSQYQISDNIKRLVNFNYLDLMGKTFPYRHLDIILCRYVFMYFKKSQKEYLLQKFHKLLNPGGFLILGGTDLMPLNQQNLFKPLSIKENIYQKPLTQEQRKLILDNFPPEDYYCEWCGEPFSSVKMIQLHLQHSPCKRGGFRCYVCKKELFSKTGLFAHLKFTHYLDKEDRITRVFNKISANN